MIFGVSSIILTPLFSQGFMIFVSELASTIIAFPCFPVVSHTKNTKQGDFGCFLDYGDFGKIGRVTDGAVILNSLCNSCIMPTIFTFQKFITKGSNVTMNVSSICSDYF